MHIASKHTNTFEIPFPSHHHKLLLLSSIWAIFGSADPISFFPRSSMSAWLSIPEHANVYAEAIIHAGSASIDHFSFYSNLNINQACNHKIYFVRSFSPSFSFFLFGNLFFISLFVSVHDKNYKHLHLGTQSMVEAQNGVELATEHGIIYFNLDLTFLTMRHLISYIYICERERESAHSYTTRTAYTLVERSVLNKLVFVLDETE